ncbi:MAG TPA: malto-oligosyltrehalose synthase [Trebonia sp.]|nr:malto-oligosyltrehalose synthase [Trebonia sp.]
MPKTPGSTYRLQLTPKFGFAEAAEAAGYLADLGVTHAYLSPVLDAVPGSQHGYDVTDHSRIRPELGGEEGFRALAGQLHSCGLGIVLDIVPNHMAVPANLALNRQLWSVLRDGRDSAYASWFDIDWTAQDDRMLLPILGGPVESCLDDLRVEPGAGPDGEPVLRYFEHVLPLWPGTSQLPVRGLLEAQHYRLAWWQDAATSLNWRRFFDIATLIGIRVEDPAVFNATHEVIIRLLTEGLVDGLRVDHPDGLADPRGYLRRLADATGGAWVVTEKILGPDEELPADWACAGTTGYDALRVVDGLFLDPAGGAALTAGYASFCRQSGGASPASGFAGVAAEAKREIAGGSLSAEVSRLAQLLCSVVPGAGADDVRTVLTEVLAAFPVYRAYVHPGEPAEPAAKAAIGEAVDGAKRLLAPRLHALADHLGEAALGLRPPLTGGADRVTEFAVRFQQTTGPVQAKGVEDTACYRWSRLVSLNEVGCEPDRLGVDPEDFHATAQRLADDWPATMTTLSTHDTKRQEDVRARLAVLAEMPAEWSLQVARWHELAGAAAAAVDPDTEYLLWQTLAGAWPISGARLDGYLTKAVREAKRRTSWTAPDKDYEAAVLGLAAWALDDKELSGSVAAFVAGIAGDAAVNALGAKLVQLTMPGVPDVYQGSELAALSLVDPDNRRPVDFARIRGDLAAIDAGAPPGGRADLAGGDPEVFDRAKLLVTSRALRLRTRHPDWFARGGYQPLEASGAAAGHVAAFTRGRAVSVATRLPAGLRRRGGWQDTALKLPAGSWTDVLTGTVHDGDAILMTELTARLPVALLVPESE